MPEIAQIRGTLRKYTALDNESRLQAYFAVSRDRGISFAELARKLNLEKGLLAYHLGVLKAAGLIDVEYKRMSRETSHYYLTDDGERLLKQLTNR